MKQMNFTNNGFYSGYGVEKDLAIEVNQKQETPTGRVVQTPNRKKISLKNYLKQST